MDRSIDLAVQHIYKTNIYFEICTIVHIFPNPASEGHTETTQFREALHIKKVLKLWIFFVPPLGKPSNRIFGKIWDFGPTEGGGGFADPKFLSNFSRTNFTMLNGQKCDETHSI